VEPQYRRLVARSCATMDSLANCSQTRADSAAVSAPVLSQSSARTVRTEADSYSCMNGSQRGLRHAPSMPGTKPLPHRKRPSTPVLRLHEQAVPPADIVPYRPGGGAHSGVRVRQLPARDSLAVYVLRLFIVIISPAAATLSHPSGQRPRRQRLTPAGAGDGLETGQVTVAHEAWLATTT
jgi:hypothetical protein